MFEPPKSYTEMLPKLHKATFFTTLFFCLILVINGYLPVIRLNAEHVPPIKDYEETIKWILTFGVLPIALSLISAIISGALDLHNNVAKFLKIRYLWEELLIIRPLARVAGVNRKLSDEESYNVMSNFYYPEVKELVDKHYVELFWNKVFYFWILFEHAIVAVVIVFLITISKAFDLFSITGRLSYLWFWVLIVVIFSFIVFFVSVKPRTESQVRKISHDKIHDFFNKNNIN
ncbi:hypothetical protein [Enterobacter asburiae]|nr:hypothetical protein [Enterobacter asburiae]